MKTKSTIYRQGDVLIERVPSLPASRKSIKRENHRVILAHGEVTGHAHAIDSPDAYLYETAEEAGVTYLEVKEAMAALVHQEHATIELAPGCYRVTRQKEYSPAEIKRVAD
jgi:hypothetical protein